MNDDRTFDLIQRFLDGGLSDSETTELRELLASSPSARTQYWECVNQHALIEDVLRESRGSDLAAVECEPVAGNESTPMIEPAAPPPTYSTTGRAIGVTSVIAILLAFGFFYFNPTRPLPAGKNVATLQSISGKVQIRNSTGGFSQAASGLQITRGDAVVVDPEEGAAGLVLTDGSHVTVDTDSVVLFSRAETENAPRLHLERGGIQMDVSPQPHENPMVVTTDHARLTVRGTRFRLYSDLTSSRVETNDGKVDFERQADGQSVEVAEGQFAVAVANDESTEPRPTLVARQLSQATCDLRHTLLRAGKIVCISHGGGLVAASNNRGPQVWDIATGAWQGSHPLAKPPLMNQLAFTGDDQAIVGLSPGGTGLWVRRQGSEGKPIKLTTEHIRAGVVAPDGRTFVQIVNSDGGKVAIWTVGESGEVSLRKTVPIKAWSVAVGSTAKSPRVDPTGKPTSGYVALGRWDGQIDILDIVSGESLQQLKVRSTAWPLAISDDGHFVAAFTNTQGLILLDRRAPGTAGASASGRLLWPANGARVAFLRFSPDGRRLLAGMEDGLVRAWNSRTGEELMVLETGDPRVSALDISADGSSLVTVGRDECVKIWQCLWPSMSE